MGRSDEASTPAPTRRAFTIRGMMIAIAALAGVQAAPRLIGLPLQLFWTLSLCLAAVAGVVCWRREGWGARGFLLVILQVPGTIVVETSRAGGSARSGRVVDLMFSHLLPALVFLYPTLLACGGCWWRDLRRGTRRWPTWEFLVLGMLGLLTIAAGGALFVLHGFLAAGIAEH